MSPPSRRQNHVWLSSAKLKSKSSPSALLTSLSSLLPSQGHRAIICPAETIGHSLLNSPLLSSIMKLSLPLFRIARLLQAKNHIALFSSRQFPCRLFSAMSWELCTVPSAKPECCRTKGVTQVMWTYCNLEGMDARCPATCSSLWNSAYSSPEVQ